MDVSKYIHIYVHTQMNTLALVINLRKQLTAKKCILFYVNILLRHIYSRFGIVTKLAYIGMRICMHVQGRRKYSAD